MNEWMNERGVSISEAADNNNKKNNGETALPLSQKGCSSLLGGTEYGDTDGTAYLVGRPYPGT